MESKKLECEVITPMFCYGTNKNSPELRPASLKGLMRNTFRIIQQEMLEPEKEESVALLAKENHLFGDAKENPSPLRFAFDEEKIKPGKKKFLFHGKEKHNRPMQYISPGSEFSIQISLRKNAMEKLKHQMKLGDCPLTWYAKLIEISLILGSLGGRNRKGRGRVYVKLQNEKLSERNVQNHILQYLNDLAFFGKYECKDGIITPTGKIGRYVNRPVIEKIEFGKLIYKKDGWDQDFLKHIDSASHEVQKIFGDKKYTTGLANPRFASSINVGVVEVEEGFLPIYTHIKPVLIKRKRNEEKKEGYFERDAFVKLIEQKGGNRYSVQLREDKGCDFGKPDSMLKVIKLPDKKKKISFKINEQATCDFKLYERTKPLAKSYSDGKPIHVKYEPLGKLAIGIGEESPYDTTLLMTLHPLYGIPYIPATVIKGMLSHYWHQEVNDEESVLQELFGNANQQGKLTFFDIFPKQYTLNFDVMTPYYSDYYQGNAPPTDDQNPIPITFPCVENAIFNVYIAYQEAGILVKYKVEEELGKAFKHYGIGAKTALGYGISKS